MSTFKISDATEDDAFRSAEAMNEPAPKPAPPEALKAKRCACPTPWVERDVDNEAHCVGCGRGL